MSIITLTAFILYMTFVVAIAVVAYFVTKNLSDFVLGGRRLNGPVAALSAGASDMSAWLLLGLPGAVFTLGLNQIWLPIGLTLGAYLSWRYLATPLRVFSEFAKDSLTLPAFLDNRFMDSTGYIRALLAGITLLFFAFYTASGLVGGAMLLQRFGFDYTHALYLGASIIIAYTFVGGFLAVSWTDFFQGILMFCCLLAVPVIATIGLEGVDATKSIIADKGEHFLNPFQGLNVLLVINLMAWGLGYLGQPHILVRYMAVKSKQDIPIARRIAITWMSLSMLGAVLTGMVGIAFFEAKDINPESIFIVFSDILFTPWLSGILFAAILSSIMCAIDSQMLASSSALTEDIYHGLIRKNATQFELVWLGRIGVIIMAIFALLLASNPDSRVIELVAFAWAGLGAAFGPAVCLALFWRRMTQKGAFWGILMGAIVVIIWKNNSGGLFELYEIIPGFIFGFVTIVLISLLDNPPSQAVLEQFDKAWQHIKN